VINFFSLTVCHKLYLVGCDFELGSQDAIAVILVAARLGGLLELNFRLYVRICWEPHRLSLFIEFIKHVVVFFSHNKLANSISVITFCETPSVRPCLVRKNFQNFPSHRIFVRMHGALNIDENKN